MYADTIERQPEVHQDIEEVEETLPDGTVVKRKIIKTRQKQTIVKRVVMEGPQGHLPMAEGGDEVTSQVALTSIDPQTQMMQMYADRMATEPVQSTDVHVYEETLADGTVRKKRIVTTTGQTQHVERRVLEGPAAAHAMVLTHGGRTDSDVNVSIISSTPDDHPQIAPMMEGMVARLVGCSVAVAVCCCLSVTSVIEISTRPLAKGTSSCGASTLLVRSHWQIFTEVLMKSLNFASLQ